MKILSFCNKLIALSFYTLFFLVPLIFAPNTSELFELNKMWVTFGLTIVIMFAWSSKMIYERKIHIQKTPFDIPLLLFLLSQFISSVISLDQRVSFWGYYSRFNGGFFSTLCYVLLYYSFASNLTVKHVYKVLVVSLISGLFVSLWGLPSHFGKDPTCFLIRGTFDVSCWTEQFQPTVRIFSTLGQPAWMASYLAILLPIALAGLLFKKPTDEASEKEHTSHSYFPAFFSTKNAVVLSIGLAILFYLDQLYANTRAGFLAFWIGNGFLWMGVLAHGTKHTKRLTLYSLFALSFLFLLYAVATSHYEIFWLVNVLGLFVAGLLVFRKKMLIYSIIYGVFLLLTFVNKTPFAEINAIFSSELLSKATQTTPPNPSTTKPTAAPTSGTVLEVGGTESGSIRKIVWKGALTAWKNNPLFGTGVETFAFAYYKYRPVEHNLTSEWDYLYNKAHNEYLNYLATTGLFGLGTYLFFIGWFLFFTLRFILNHHETPTQQTNIVVVVLALLSGFVTILIANFFGFSVVITNLYLFLIPLFVLLLTNSLLPNKAFLFRFGEERKGTGLSPYQWTGVALLGLFSGYMLLSLMRFWYADTKYALGHNLNNVGEYSMAAPLLLNAVQIRPSEVVFTDELAINSASLAIAALKENAQQNAATASQLAQQALALSEQATQNHHNNILVWKNRVRVLYLLAQANPEFYKQALSAMLTSKQLAPTDAKISYNLGVLYGQIGDMQKGIETLDETIRLKPNYRDAYFAQGLFYHELSLENDKVTKPELHQKAVERLQFILKNFNPDDKQVKETLTSWGEK